MGLSLLNFLNVTKNSNSQNPLEVIRLYRTTLFGFIILLALISLLYLISRELGFLWPYGSMLFRADDRFGDLLNSIQAASTANPYSGNTASISPYFPLAYAILKLFSYLGKWGSLVLYFLIGYSALYFAIRRVVSDQYLSSDSLTNERLVNICFLVFILSYPYIFAVDRGGLDFWVSGLLFIYIAYRGGKCSLISIFAISVAIALKGYPLAFCLILLTERKYKELIWIGLLVFLLTFISLLCFDSSIIILIQGIKASQINFFNKYVLGVDSLFGTADFFSAIKLLVLLATNDTKTMTEYASRIFSHYMILNTLITLSIGIVVLFFRVTFAQKLLLITLISTIYPNLTNDYRLAIFVMPAFYMSVASDRYSRLIFWIIIAILAPKNFIFYNGYGLTGLVTPLLLMMLGLATIFSIIKNNYFQSRWHH
jgi:hypothetical protein